MKKGGCNHSDIINQHTPTTLKSDVATHERKNVSHSHAAGLQAQSDSLVSVVAQWNDQPPIPCRLCCTILLSDVSGKAIRAELVRSCLEIEVCIAIDIPLDAIQQVMSFQLPIGIFLVSVCGRE